MHARRTAAPLFRQPALLAATLGLAALPVLASQGLQTPAAGDVWPTWQARVTLQALVPSPLSLGPLALLPPGDTAAGGRSVQSGALFGDYVFASPRFGQFRATSGLVIGTPVGASPLSQWSGAGLAAAPLALNLAQSGVSARSLVPNERATLPYLGLGYSGAFWLPGLSVVADVGVVSENFSALGQWARAAAGSTSFDQTLREMRWTPVLQVGLRWAF